MSHAEIHAIPGEPIEVGPQLDLETTELFFSLSKGGVVLSGGNFLDTPGRVYITCPLSAAEPDGQSNPRRFGPDDEIVVWGSATITLLGFPRHPGNLTTSHACRLLVYLDGNTRQPADNDTDPDSGADFGVWVAVRSLAGYQGAYPPYGH